MLLHINDSNLNTWKLQLRSVVTGSADAPVGLESLGNRGFQQPQSSSRRSLSTGEVHDMQLFGIRSPVLEIMATRVLEWGHRAWRDYRDSTWIRMDLVPSDTGSSRNSGVPGHTGGRRRVLVEL